MLSRNTVAVALALLALGQLGSALNLGLDKISGKHDFGHISFKHSISGKHDMAAGHDEPRVEKADSIKEMLGLAGPTTASVVPAGCKSVYEIVSASPDHTFLKNAIEDTGLTSLLSNPALVATVFAPTDAAFTSTLAFLELEPQELFDDVVALTVLLKYHVIPGLSLEKSDFKDSQPYDTLLTDKHGDVYSVIYDYFKEIDLKEAKLEGDLEAASEQVYRIVPSGGKAAKISKFDINAGCPSIVHVINRVLIPDFADALLVDAADTAISTLAAYQAAGAPLPVNSEILAAVSKAGAASP